MSISNELHEAMAAFNKKVEQDDELRRLRDFYDAAKRDGIATKHEYDLPQLDTIGRFAFER
jgi:hypothetical protein